jgi:hypothetical protein
MRKEGMSEAMGESAKLADLAGGTVAWILPGYRNLIAGTRV